MICQLCQEHLWDDRMTKCRILPCYKDARSRGRASIRGEGKVLSADNSFENRNKEGQ